MLTVGQGEDASVSIRNQGSVRIKWSKLGQRIEDSHVDNEIRASQELNDAKVDADSDEENPDKLFYA